MSDLLDSFRTLCETTIDHPSLARPLAFGAEGNTPYVVYSDLAGTAMDAVMRKDGPRPVAEVLERTKQLADALDVAASAGVHHGLMTPCDVILDRERSGITGFGLTNALIKVAFPAEAESPYGSPQRIAGAPPTRADDIYSLAAITLELLIGTPRDPEQEAREAQGLPERRRVPRPAPHETRVFTTIAGVDAGKLRACFAAAFAEEPGERPSTAAAFAASFEDACSIKRVADEPAAAVPPSVVEDDFVSEEPEEPRPAPVLETRPATVSETKPAPAVETKPAPAEETKPAPVSETKPADVLETKRSEAIVNLPTREEREPIVDVALFAQVTAPPDAPVPWGSRALLIAAAVAFSFGAGFGGGFLTGRRLTPSTESIPVIHNEPVAQPQPTRVEDPTPIASTTSTVAPISKETTRPVSKETARPVSKETVRPVSKETASPVSKEESGRLTVRSTPAGAGVVVDGQSRGVTPLAVHDLAFGTHTIEVTHEGQATRWLRMALSERRPSRSVDFDFRPAIVAANDAAAPRLQATNATGSLHVASRPAGAQVFVDDNLIGTTPLLLSNVATGSKSLRIELSGYKIFTTSVQIAPSARSRVAASLEASTPQ